MMIIFLLGLFFTFLLSINGEIFNQILRVLFLKVERISLLNENDLICDSPYRLKIRDAGCWIEKATLIQIQIYSFIVIFGQCAASIYRNIVCPIVSKL